jgi:arabinogalactan endo-1,4-beta-galactosidase
MIDLMQAVVDGGGLGVVYWEPAWISSACATRWGQGSHWENATLFDYAHAELHQGSSFLNPATVTGPTHATQ